MDGSTDREACFPIPITNDNELEGPHNFTVDIISAGSTPHAAIDVTNSATTVVIIDDER